MLNDLYDHNEYSKRLQIQKTLKLVNLTRQKLKNDGLNGGFWLYLCGRMDGELDEDDSFLFDGEILAWGDIAMAFGDVTKELKQQYKHHSQRILHQAQFN